MNNNFQALAEQFANDHEGEALGGDILDDEIRMFISRYASNVDPAWESELFEVIQDHWYEVS